MKDIIKKNGGITKKTTLNSVKGYDSCAEERQLFNDPCPIYSHLENGQKLIFNSALYSSQSEASLCGGKETPSNSYQQTVRKRTFFSPCIKRNRLSDDKQKESEKYYIYWKNKANEYQMQNFALMRQNDLLKRNIQQMKFQQIKLKLTNQKQQKELKKIVELEKDNQQYKKVQEILYTRMKQLERQLTTSMKIIEHLEKRACMKFQELNTTNFGSFKLINDKIRQVPRQNKNYKYSLKDISEQVKTINKISPLFNEGISLTSLTTIQISDNPLKEKINKTKLF